MELAKIGDNQVAVSDNFEKMEFGISQENIGLILETLRSKMYSNPIAAICREIASNCRDSHREAGIPSEPIEIKLADGDVFMGVNEGVDATINFIDYGVGISPERVKNIYLLFGASSKRNDNSQTGGFGYGAKTPFAYSDSFAVVTVYEGKKYTYFFSIGESRRGDAFLISEIDTDERNGTTVSIPLKDEDKSKFEYELIRATYFWDVTPKFTGRWTTDLIQTFENRDSTIMFKKQKFLMASQMAPGSFNKFGFLIDGIYYDYNTTKELEGFRTLLDRTTGRNSKMFLRFNTGEVSVSTNRESLYYDKKTIDTILKNSREYTATIKKEYIKGLKDFDGLYYKFSYVTCYRKTFDDVNSANITAAMEKTVQLHESFQAFDPKFVADCIKKYFKIFPLNKRHNRHNSRESRFLNDVDNAFNIYTFGKYVGGEKREKRGTQTFSRVVYSIIHGAVPTFQSPVFIERDSLKKNLTIFSEGKTTSNWYQIIVMPRLNREFLHTARNHFKTQVDTAKAALARYKSDAPDYARQQELFAYTIKMAKETFASAIHSHAVLKRFLREFKVVCKNPIPTYDSIPETKIARTPGRILPTSAIRAVRQHVSISRHSKNGTCSVRQSKDASYRETRLSEISYAIVMPTKSNNVYQIQNEVKNVTHRGSHIDRIALLYYYTYIAKLSAAKNISGIDIVYVKQNDYKNIKSEVGSDRVVVRLDDLIAAATKKFKPEVVDKMMKTYWKLMTLSKYKENQSSNVRNYVSTNLDHVYPSVVKQYKFEVKMKRLMEKYNGDRYYDPTRELTIFKEDHIKTTKQYDVLPVTKIHELLESNKLYQKLMDLFEKAYKHNEIKKVMTTDEVFKRHYGVFISNCVQARGYYDKVGLRKMIKLIDKKYEAYSKNK